MSDDLARYIDHTLLKPESTPADIDRICDEAMKYRFAAVCFNPVWIRRAAGGFGRLPDEIGRAPCRERV